MLRRLLTVSRPQQYNGLMYGLQGMQGAPGSGVSSSSAIFKRSTLFTRRFKTLPYTAAKRSVLVEAAKKDPEELVKRIGRGDLHSHFTLVVTEYHCHAIAPLPQQSRVCLVSQRM